MSVDYAGAVGSKQPDAVSVGDLLHLQLDLQAVLAKFCKPCGLDDDIAYSALTALLHDIRRDPCRDQDDSHINWLRHRADARICLAAADLIGTGIYGIELSSELVADQIGKDVPSQFSRCAGGTNDCNALRIEQVVQVLLFSLRRLWSRIAQNDASINHHVALWIEEHWIEIHLRDIGIVHHEVGY